MEYFLIIIGMIGMFGLGYGMSGRRGPRGEPGYNGPQGAKGDRGDRGPRGHGFRIVGSVSTKTDLPGTGNVTGDTYVVMSTNECWTWSDEGWFPVGAAQDPNTIRGPQGIQGPNGVPPGPSGVKGESDLTAYDIAVKNGYTGTKEDWMAQWTANWEAMRKLSEQNKLE